MRNRLLPILTTSAFLVPLLAGSVRADTTTCTGKITAVPFTIAASGNYCFDKNLSATATATTNAITINADFVTLDLNGFKLDGSAAAPGARKGVYATGRKGIVVRNGVIRGFNRAVSLEGAGANHVVDDIRAEANATTGIWIEGANAVVRNCKVSATLPPTPDTSAEGIRVMGSQARILNNDVLDTLATDSGVSRGIVVQGAPSVIEHNRIGNSSMLPGSVGITLTGGQDHLLAFNSLTILEYGLVFEIETFGKYRDTLTSGVNNPYNGGSDAGNNQ
jgi:hypothetical protein